MASIINVDQIRNAAGTSSAEIKSDGTFYPAGGVVQVQQTFKDDVFNTTGNSSHEDITGLSVSITPKSTSSKVLVSLNLGCVGVNASGAMAIRLYRGSTVIGNSDQGTSDPRDGSIVFYHNNQTGIGVSASFSFLDSPSTTSATTYKASMYVNGGTGYLNRLPGDATWGSASTITAMEIAG